MSRKSRMSHAEFPVMADECSDLRWAAVALRAGWRSEDVTGSDAPPDDVRLPGHALGSIAEGSAPIIVPGHLENVRVGFHAFDAQTRPERPVWGHQIRHEGFLDHLAERILVLGRDA